MIKKSLQEEDITFVNIYAFNIGIPKHRKSSNRRKGKSWQEYNNRRTDLSDRKSISLRS